MSERGFTLVETLMVILLIGALGAVTAVFIIPPFQASADLERRAALVDAADLALDRIVREVRGALPNSVRVHGSNHLEFIHVRTAGRYRRLPPQGPPPPGGTAIFIPAQAASSFNVLGPLLDAGVIDTGGGAPATSSGDWVSVYNTGQPDLDAYAGESIGRITGLAESSGNFTVSYDQASFSLHSPRQRFYVFDTVISYVCAGGELRRFWNYGLTESPATPPAGGASALLVGDVEACSFSYAPGTAERRGLLTLRLDLARQGERIFLLDQAQVLNSP